MLLPTLGSIKPLLFFIVTKTNIKFTRNIKIYISSRKLQAIFKLKKTCTDLGVENGVAFQAPCILESGVSPGLPQEDVNREVLEENAFKL